MRAGMSAHGGRSGLADQVFRAREDRHFLGRAAILTLDRKAGREEKSLKTSLISFPCGQLPSWGEPNVTKRGGLFTSERSPPHGTGTPWLSCR